MITCKKRENKNKKPISSLYSCGLKQLFHCLSILSGGQTTCRPDSAVPHSGSQCDSWRGHKGMRSSPTVKHVNESHQRQMFDSVFPLPLPPYLQSVQSVISNLLISHIELRSDESPDIRAHCHQRNVEKVVVPLGEALSAHQARYLQVRSDLPFPLVLGMRKKHSQNNTHTLIEAVFASVVLFSAIHYVKMCSFFGSLLPPLGQ